MYVCKYIFETLLKNFFFLYLLAALCGLSLVVVSGSYSLLAVCGLLTEVASLVAECGPGVCRLQ